MTTDEAFMQAAIGLAAQNLGSTAPNPAVGCIITQNIEGRPAIIARGVTAVGGRPHAERIALDQAGDAARGACAYVTLEPCAHHGKTPPCADALIAAGVKRVVIGCPDPDPRVAGQGITRLRAAGIEVIEDILHDQAVRLTIGHIRRVRDQRPAVFLKMALSANGCVAQHDKTPVAITGALANAYTHRLRASMDALLIGIETALHDNPLLTVRLDGIENRSPIRIVLDSRARLSPQSRLVATVDQHPVWLMVGAGAHHDNIKALQQKGVRVLQVETAANGRLDVRDGLRLLAEEGITRLMVEAGPTLAHSLIAQNLVDEITLLRGAQKIAAGLPGLDENALHEHFRLSKKLHLGDDCCEIYNPRV